MLFLFSSVNNLDLLLTSCCNLSCSSQAAPTPIGQPLWTCSFMIHLHDGIFFFLSPLFSPPWQPLPQTRSLGTEALPLSSVQVQATLFNLILNQGARCLASFVVREDLLIPGGNQTLGASIQLQDTQQQTKLQHFLVRFTPRLCFRCYYELDCFHMSFSACLILIFRKTIDFC